MKNSKELHNLTRQNEKNVQKSQKHDVNLRKNSSLYFQIGLIMCLLATYGSLEMRFEDKTYNLSERIIDDPEKDYMFAPVFKVEPDAVTTKEPLQKQPVRPDNPTIVPDDTPDTKVNKDDLVSDIVQPTKPEGKKPPVNEGDLDIKKPDEEVHVNFVEMVPIYPGCEKAKNNDQRRKCMSDKLAKLVKNKFDRDLGEQLGLKEGIQRIYVNFRINKNGDVEIINTRAPHKDLEKEANRVVDKVPQMKPGRQGGQPVSVLYSLPIVFQVKY
ncbi:energy transducer TonB [Olleya sp. YS]|uniref:energy transducer TonB n=1 Tax=Olleya sp. YS TaxID=3028318 RepID=UPI0024345548|nr:energy transducer TonB [Olleya sp. YS]WGD35438.1 energy transducer TonB [Olleya sp. YS]